MSDDVLRFFFLLGLYDMVTLTTCNTRRPFTGVSVPKTALSYRALDTRLLSCTSVSDVSCWLSNAVSSGITDAWDPSAGSGSLCSSATSAPIETSLRLAGHELPLSFPIAPASRLCHDSGLSENDAFDKWTLSGMHIVTASDSLGQSNSLLLFASCAHRLGVESVSYMMGHDYHYEI
jgi:hypothetical protein